MGAVLAVLRVWDASLGLLHGELGGSTDLTVAFLEIVSVMLKAVVFYIIGIGLYSLFIAPLNLRSISGSAAQARMDGLAGVGRLQSGSGAWTARLLWTSFGAAVPALLPGSHRHGRPSALG